MTRKGLIFDGRFTPTCVGTIKSYPLWTNMYPVHPHVRGDNKILSIMDKYVSGSPPRAWGQY
ncbi:conserved hypothetical protein [uncultured Desulfobacterium sp.]|uniref:Uncharacterized protein n=1 Tax=uncultured Desulfobacterium sp. TaxID=201089 RepID=A0A445N0F6_9BACT|nr:conserved hypothetical protein [uncultured Desulfobacterium sp.]